jgi:photosystem II stability/assembly factor-like uncharacterized protein
MKKLTFILLLIGFQTTSALNWEWLSGGYYLKIQMRNINNIWVTGYRDRVLKIEDDGKIINFLSNTDSNTHIQNLFFLDSIVGWNIDLNNYLYKTNNGGITWECLYLFDSSYKLNLYPLTNIKFLDSTFGCVFGNSSDSGFIAKTTNSGRSWNYMFFNNKIINFWMFDEWNYTFYDSKGIVFKTSNGGLTWSQTCSIEKLSFRSIYFVNPDTAWIAGTYDISRTTDGGRTWEQQYHSSYWYSDICFINSKVGWIVGTGGTIIFTDNAGENWSELVTDIFEMLYSVKFTDINNGWIAGDDGTIFRTHDGGKNWVSIQRGTRYHIKGIDFIDENKGFACGDNWVLLKTTNGGLVWEKIDVGSYSLFLWDLHFLNSSYGWIYGDHGIILKTTNGGNNWTQYKISTNSRIENISIISEDIGWAVCYNMFYKTTDGGLSWSNSTEENFYETHDIFFSDKDNGWRSFIIYDGIIKDTIRCYRSIIQKTTDCGINWTNNIVDSLQITRYSGTISNYRKIFFINSDIGWIQLQNNFIMRTVDGGKNWKTVNVSNSFSIYNFKFYNELIGWAIGDNGKIFYTSDGGNSWIEQLSFRSRVLSGLCILNESNVYVSGDFGTILKYCDSEIKSNVKEIFIDQREKFPIFPNPATDFINFQDMNNENATYSIYSCLGILVYQGQINNKIDISFLPTGIYFVKIRDSIHKLIKI